MRKDLLDDLEEDAEVSEVPPSFETRPTNSVQGH